jgi:hypothetical protein
MLIYWLAMSPIIFLFGLVVIYHVMVWIEKDLISFLFTVVAVLFLVLFFWGLVHVIPVIAQ